jgi:hypothetical protein
VGSGVVADHGVLPVLLDLSAQEIADELDAPFGQIFAENAPNVVLSENMLHEYPLFMEMSEEWYQGFVETGFGESGGP